MVSDALTFSLSDVGNTDLAFAIRASGELIVATAAALDFETTPTFNLSVHVTDAVGNVSIGSATVTIIEAVNQPPTIADQTFNIDEGSASGTSVGFVIASDVDGDALTFSLSDVGNTDLAFSIFASGELTVSTNATLDFETIPPYFLSVHVTDAFGNVSIGAIIINLNDLDENTAPVINDQTFTIDENLSISSLVGIVIATDPENDALIYAIVSGNELGAFQIDQNTGELTVADSAPLDFEMTPSFGLGVEVSDGVLNDTAKITINLNDISEVEVLGIDQNSIVANIYPNPFSNVLTIEWQPFERAIIRDLSGRQILVSSSRVLVLSNLPNGVYLLTIVSSSNEQEQVKIMKE